MLTFLTYDLLDALSRPWVQSGLITAAGLAFLIWRWYRIAVALMLLAAFWAWLCSTPAFATWLQQRLISEYPPQLAASYPKAQVIVVLGGGGPTGPGNFRESHGGPAPNTRIGFGLRLYEAGRAPIILLSGGEGGAITMAKIARGQGIPTDSLQTEQRSTSTHQNALFSAAILKRENKQRILLVTSALHMPRAAASFRRQGLAVIPAPVPNITRLPGKTRHDWWPQRRARWLTNRCMHEYFGLWAYKLVGWA